MGTYSQVPITHYLKHHHQLDAIRAEVLQLEVVLVENPRMNSPVGMEKPRSWKAMNETTYPLGRRGTESSPGTFHSTTTVSGGSFPASMRRHSWSRDMRDRVQFDVAVARSRTNRRRNRWLCCGRKEERGARRKSRGK
jgi:hypothetical protein